MLAYSIPKHFLVHLQARRCRRACPIRCRACPPPPNADTGAAPATSEGQAQGPVEAGALLSLRAGWVLACARMHRLLPCPLPVSPAACGAQLPPSASRLTVESACCRLRVTLDLEGVLEHCKCSICMGEHEMGPAARARPPCTLDQPLTAWLASHFCTQVARELTPSKHWTDRASGSRSAALLTSCASCRPS